MNRNLHIRLLSNQVIGVANLWVLECDQRGSE